MQHAPVSRDLDLRRVRAKELDVRVTILVQEWDDKSPGLGPFLDLKELLLQALLLLRSYTARRRVGLLYQLCDRLRNRESREGLGVVYGYGAPGQLAERPLVQGLESRGTRSSSPTTSAASEKSKGEPRSVTCQLRSFDTSEFLIDSQNPT